MTDSTYDAVVVGGGPAGLAAATWLGRYRRRTLVVDASEHRNRWTELAHGYLGADPVAPEELLARARKDLARYESVVFAGGRVRAIEGEAGGFRVLTDDGTVGARAIVLAAGVVDVFPVLEYFEEHYGASVFHCPSCDGYEWRDKRIAVLGWSEDVAALARNLRNWAVSVTVIGSHEMDADHDWIAVVRGRPVGLEGERGALDGVRLDDGSIVSCDAVFFSTGQTPRSELAESLGCSLDPCDLVVVDEDGRTSVPGVWAAGDLVPGPQTIQAAAASGAAAGICCAKTLSGQKHAEGAGPADVPELGSLDELCRVVAETRETYVRHSKGPEDDAGRTSRDYESGLDLPGLSVNPLRPEPWWSRPLEDWVARQVCHYVHISEDEPDRRAWVLTGRIAGWGPDREPLLQPWTPVASLGPRVIAEARALYEERFDAGRDSTG